MNELKKIEEEKGKSQINLVLERGSNRRWSVGTKEGGEKKQD